MIDLDSCLTFSDLWNARVAISPDFQFLVFEDEKGEVREFTYREFDNWVRQIRLRLAAEGVEKGDRVALCSHNCPEGLAIRFALAGLGIVLASVNPCSSEHDLEVYQELCTPRVVIILGGNHQAHFGEGAAWRASVHVIEGEEAYELCRYDYQEKRIVCDESYAAPDPLDTLEIVFTSGTTSRPKGVEITQSNAVHAARIGAMALSLRANDRFLIAVPLFHVDAPYCAVASSVLTGGTVILLAKFSASRYLAQCRRHRATVTHCVAMMIKTMLLQEPSVHDTEHDLRQISYFMKLSADDVQKCSKRFGVRMLNSYGLSESVTSVTMDCLTGECNPDAIGLPIHPFEIAIWDENHEPMPCGEAGEIVVKGIPGHTIMKGYYGNLEATADAIIGGEWLRTKDLGFIDEQGNVHFVDRIKNIIKCKGENISATEVEECLAQCEGVTDVAVIGVADEICGEKVLAIVVTGEEPGVLEEQLRAHCTQKLATFKWPAENVMVVGLPYTATCKIDRKELMRRYRR